MGSLKILIAFGALSGTRACRFSVVKIVAQNVPKNVVFKERL
jgi:hypothetical protein